MSALLPVRGSNGGLLTVKEDGQFSFDPRSDFEHLAPSQTAETRFAITIRDARGALAGSDFIVRVYG
jgi:VCBS repeat-containing protein